MSVNKTDIYVYADWQGLVQPTLVGVLSAHQAKGRKAFSFEYDPFVFSPTCPLFADDLQ